ncbi:MAG TPA: STAS domain-containing protein, partial [Trebonia sp.]|nr:STAS domain-containing protein [Trebonia sp.]
MFSVRLSSRDCPGHVTVALHGELDLVDAPDVAVALAAASSREPLVIVDLTGLSFIDASGVAALARGRDYTRGGGGELLLSGPREQVWKMLAIVFPAEDFFVSSSPAEPPGGRDVSDPWPDFAAARTGARLRSPSHGRCHCFW